MKKEMSARNSTRFIQIGLNITALREARGMSREELAERASVSGSLIRSIEDPETVKSFSMEVLYSIADALDINPSVLLEDAPASVQTGL